jgi:hypothetical protein
MILERSQYQNVYRLSLGKFTQRKPWMARMSIKGEKIEQKYLTEKEAAIAIDLFRIRKGRPPVNILKSANEISK